MEAARAIERSGFIDAQHRPIAKSTRVRVIVLFAEGAEIEEGEWLYAAATNPAFDFLKDPAEDIYTIKDRKPFHDQE